MIQDVRTGNYFVPCPTCRESTEVSARVHADVPLHGMQVGCWACGRPMTIPPTPATIECARRQMVDLGVAMIASGDIERGKATLRESENLGDA